MGVIEKLAENVGLNACSIPLNAHFFVASVLLRVILGRR